MQFSKSGIYPVGNENPSISKKAAAWMYSFSMAAVKNFDIIFLKILSNLYT